MKNQKGFSPFIVLIVLGLAIVGGLYFVTNKMTTTKTNSTPSSPVVTESTMDETEETQTPGMAQQQGEELKSATMELDAVSFAEFDSELSGLDNDGSGF